jgi:hypothetical protein
MAVAERVRMELGLLAPGEWGRGHLCSVHGIHARTHREPREPEGG